MIFLFEKIKGGNKEQFANKVIDIANQLGIYPSWLMIIMNFESGLNWQAVNKMSGATGLIQFMPSTAQGLGTTTAELLNMSNIEQLDFVYKYLYPYRGKIKSLTDLYLRVFYPLAVGKSNDYILGGQGATGKKIAHQNAIFDYNKDGYIQKSEVEKYINAYAEKLGYNANSNISIKKKFLF